MNVNAGVVEKKDLSCIEGVVWRDGGNGKRDETRRIKGAIVTLDRFSGYPGSTTRTRKDGTYEIWLLPFPSYEVYSIRVTKRGYAPTTQLNPDDFTDSKKDSDIGDDGFSETFHVKTAKEVVRIDAGLSKSPGASPRVLTIDCTNSTVSVAPVDEDNMFEIRDFSLDAMNTFAFPKADLIQGISVTQTPKAGTVLVGPENKFNVTVSATAGETTIRCHVEFETVDLDPPIIEIFGVQDRGYYLKDNLPLITAKGLITWMGLFLSRFLSTPCPTILVWICRLGCIPLKHAPWMQREILHSLKLLLSFPMFLSLLQR